MLRQMFSTAPCENPKRSNFWVLYSGHCLSRTHGGPASFFFLTCIWIWVEVILIIVFCKQKVACLRGFANCVLGRLSFFSLAISLSLGSKSRLWARSQTISIHFTPKLPMSKQMFVWPHRRFSVLWACEKHAKIKRCKGDRSLCDEDICSAISAPCCAIELWQFMCCSRL